MKSCGISSDPKLAHLLDETLTLGLRQGFDFFDDLFCGHLIRIPTKLTIYLQKEQCPRLPVHHKPVTMNERFVVAVALRAALML